MKRINNIVLHIEIPGFQSHKRTNYTRIYLGEERFILLPIHKQKYNYKYPELVDNTHLYTIEEAVKIAQIIYKGKISIYLVKDLFVSDESYDKSLGDFGDMLVYRTQLVRDISKYKLNLAELYNEDDSEDTDNGYDDDLFY